MVEYASCGSLFEYLSSAESEDISMKQIMTWAMEIAKGIIYTLTHVNQKREIECSKCTTKHTYSGSLAEMVTLFGKYNPKV